MNTTFAQPTRDALAAYEAAGHPRSTRHFTEHMRAESAAHLARTRCPLRRMASPGGLHRSGTEADGRNTVPVWIGEKGLMMDMPGDGLAPVRVSHERIKTVLDSSRYLLMPLTPRTASALETSVGRRGDGDSRQAAQHVAVLRRMTSSSKMLVLSAALSRTFYAPTGQDADDVTAWAKVLGASDDPAGWRELAAHVLTPARDFERKHTDEAGIMSSREYAVQIQQIEDKLDAEVVRRLSATSAAAAFSMVTSVEECWGAICRTDELLVPFYLLTGEVVEVTARQWQASSVVGALSNPSKVKLGDVLLMLGRRVADVTLADLGYNEAERSLLGVFGKRPSSDPRQRYRWSASKRAVLHDLVDHPGRVFITSAPFLGFGTASTAKWSRADEAQMGELAPISMPIDVAVAGSPVEG